MLCVVPRTLAAPPATVKLTIEAVATLFGEKDLDWADLRRFVQKKDFIPMVVNFDPKSVTPALRAKVCTRVCSS